MVKITEMPKYSSYVEPGAKWLGKVPAEWSITRLKFSSKINPPPRIEREKLSFNACFLPMESVHSSGQVEYSIQKTIKELRQGFTSFQRGDVIVAKITPCFENGKGAYLEVMPTEHGFGSTEFHVLRVGTGFNPKFIYYLTKTDLFMKLGERLMTGSAGQKRVQTEFVANFEFAHPSLACQSYIVDFLDKKTAQIDEAIAIKEQQIALLKERKQIIIQKAVTRGLDPNVPMKDSGVDWIGQMPEHWEVKRAKYISSLKGRQGWQGLKSEEYKDEGPHVLSSAHFNNYKIDWDKCPRVSYERYLMDENIQLRIGDVLLMKDGANMGKLAFVDRLPGPACLNSHLLLFRSFIDCGKEEPFFHPKFMFFHMMCNEFQDFVKVNGTGSTFLGISQESLGNYPVFLPPFDEQKLIVSYLEQEADNYDQAITQQELQIQKLKEYKTTLINSAVTGKIKITPEMVEA